MSTTDAEEQAEEAASLEAIYGDEVVVWDSGNSALKVGVPRVHSHTTRRLVQQQPHVYGCNAALSPSFSCFQDSPLLSCPLSSSHAHTAPPALRLQVYLPSRADEHHTVTLRVLLPPNYPSAAGPVMELEAQHNNSSNSDSNYGSHHSVSAPPIALEQQLAAAVRHMEDMYSPGRC